MKRYFPIVFLTATAILSGVYSCKSWTGIPEDFDYGKIEGNVYSNAYFNFTWDMGDTWAPMDNSIMDSLRHVTEEELAASDPELHKTMKAADVRTANLLTAVYQAPGEFQLFSANINFVAENVRIAVSMKDGKDYLEAAQKYMDQMSYSMERKGDIYEQKVDDVKFHVMDVINHMGDGDIFQSYYAAIIHNFAFTFITTYVTEEQKAAMEKAIQSMKFSD